MSQRSQYPRKAKRAASAPSSTAPSSMIGIAPDAQPPAPNIPIPPNIGSSSNINPSNHPTARPEAPRGSVELVEQILDEIDESQEIKMALLSITEGRTDLVPQRLSRLEEVLDAESRPSSRMTEENASVSESSKKKGKRPERALTPMQAQDAVRQMEAKIAE